MLGSERSTVSTSPTPMPKPMRMWVSLSARCSRSSRVTTLPISTSPPPLGYLVSAWTEMSTPCPVPLKSKGAKARPAPQVLSSAVMHAPRARQAPTSAGRSGNSIVTEPAASTQTSLVRSDSLAARSAGFMAS